MESRPMTSPSNSLALKYVFSVKIKLPGFLKPSQNSPGDVQEIFGKLLYMPEIRTPPYSPQSKSPLVVSFRVLCDRWTCPRNSSSPSRCDGEVQLESGR